MDLTEIVACLSWMANAGADEVIAEKPTNRLKSRGDTNFDELAHLERSLIEVKEAKNSFTSSKNIELSNDKNLDVAYNAARGCKSLDEIFESVTKFSFYGNTDEMYWQIVSEGRNDAPLVVLNEPQIDILIDQNEPNLSNKKVLLKNIFDSIGFNIHNDKEDFLYSIKPVPWVSDGSRKSSDYNLDTIWPFLLRCIILIKPAAVVLIGNKLSKKWREMDNLQEDSKGLEDLHVLNFPALDVLLKAPKRKRSVWEQLLALKKNLSTRELSDGG